MRYWPYRFGLRKARLENLRCHEATRAGEPSCLVLEFTNDVKVYIQPRDSGWFHYEVIVENKPLLLKGQNHLWNIMLHSQQYKRGPHAAVYTVSLSVGDQTMATVRFLRPHPVEIHPADVLNPAWKISETHPGFFAAISENFISKEYFPPVTQRRQVTEMSFSDQLMDRIHHGDI